MPFSFTPGVGASPAAMSCEPSFATAAEATDRARGSSGLASAGFGADDGGVVPAAAAAVVLLATDGALGTATGAAGTAGVAGLSFGGAGVVATGAWPKENDGFAAPAPKRPGLRLGFGASGEVLLVGVEDVGTAKGGAERGELERGAVEVKLRKEGDLAGRPESAGVGVEATGVEEAGGVEAGFGLGAKLNVGGFAGAAAEGLAGSADFAGAKLKAALSASGLEESGAGDEVGEAAGLSRDSNDG